MAEAAISSPDQPKTESLTAEQKEIEDNKVEVPKPEPSEKEKNEQAMRHDYVEAMVGTLANGEWQKARENERLEKRYGSGWLGKLNQWLGGEKDYTYDSETGEVKHNVSTEVGRRSASVLWKTAKTAAAILGIGLLTGGTGAIPAGAILGSALGRGVAEAWKGFAGKEGSIREKLVLARAEYYSEAQKLAREIGPENPVALPADQLEQYHKERNSKIEALVKLVFSEEQKETKKNGEEKAEPQKSLGQVIAAEKELSGFEKKWRIIEEALAFAGGITGGIYASLHAKEQIVQNLHERLASGESMKMDINQDGIWHNVVKVDEGVRQANDISMRYVFNYDSAAEQAAARANDALVLNQGEFGSHVLWDVEKGVNQLAGSSIARQGVSTVLGLISGWGITGISNYNKDKINNSNAKSLSEDRKKSIDLLIEKKEQRKADPMEPVAGEIWEYKTKSGKGPVQKVEIVSVDKNDTKNIIVEVKPVDGESKKIQKLILSTFIASQAKRLTAIEKVSAKESVAEKQKSQPEGLTEEQKNRIRQASNYTIEQLPAGGYEKLYATTEKEGDEKFKKITKELWKKFAVHGITKYNKNGDMTFVAETDLDGRTSMGLFQEAGFDVATDVSFISQGDIENGRVVVDSGKRDGVVYDEESNALIIDHHAAASSPEFSAAHYVYETLVGMGLIDKSEAFDKLVDFLNSYDNARFPINEELYKESFQTLYGLGRYMSFKNLYQFFKDGKKPTDILTSDEMKKYGVYNYSEIQKKYIGDTEKWIDLLESTGFSVESERYGDILIDFEKKLPGAYDGARAFGYDTYVIWDAKKQSFFISSSFGIQDEIPGGEIYRRNMCMKPRTNKEPLQITLRELLDIMTDGDFYPEGELAKYLEAEDESNYYKPAFATPEALPAAA